MLKVSTLAAILAAGSCAQALAAGPDLAAIQTVVVIYAENRSFDNLYGAFPGADGLANAKPEQYIQRDRDGSIMRGLPPIWGGSPAGVAKGAPVAPVAVTQAQSEAWLRTFNHPYSVDALYNEASFTPGITFSLVLRTLRTCPWVPSTGWACDTSVP